MNPLTWPLDTSGFVPRWQCGHWFAELGWLHIVSDVLIWLAYLAIPAVLVYFLRKRRDLPFPKVMWLFGAFIVVCGTTHLIEAIIFWVPVYRLAGLVKLATAIVSWATVIALIPIIPQALSMRTSTQLEHEVSARNAELTEANATLQREMQERLHVKRQVREQREWLQVILSCIGEGVIATDSRGQIAFLNSAAESLTGFSEEDAVGKPLGEVFRTRGNPSEIQSLPSELFTASEGQADRVPNQRVLIHRDLSERFIEKWQSPIRLDGSGFAGVVVTFRDVTDRKRLEDQLHQSQKMESVGRLAGGVAHDFNNMVTVINGCSELVIQALADDDPSVPLINEIKSAGERAAGLTRQLLAFSRQQIITPQVVDLNRVVLETERMMVRLLRDDIRVSLQLASNPSPVLADRGQMQQILMNLALNARDAMPSGGMLSISTFCLNFDSDYVRRNPQAHEGRHIVVEVSDTGCGLSEAAKVRLFEPFFTTKEVGRGTGLGLAVVHGIVTQTGGHIEVSTLTGKGTKFRVCLPAASSALSAVAMDDSEPSELPRGNETILLIEDERGVRSFVRSVLTRCGYTVLDAPDGLQAIALATEHAAPIDLVITDVVMPGIGGNQAADYIRQLHPESKLLFISGYTDDAILRNGVRCEDVNFLGKPFTTTSIARKVRETLNALV